MSVEQKLKSYIENKGIKVVFIAQKTGINESLLGKSLNNKRKLTANEFINICNVLGLDLEFFSNSNLQPTG